MRYCQKHNVGLVGDVEFDEVAPKCSYITPVPGGVGSLFALGGSAFTYSVIASPAFGAVQTVLGAHN